MSAAGSSGLVSGPAIRVVVAILRRIPYTILTLFRSVTQRSDERRQVPWKELMLDLFVAFLTTTDEQIRDLRPRLSSERTASNLG